MRKLPLLTALAISALSLSTHSTEAQGYAPWPPPPGMTAGEYAARYGHRITPDQYRGPPAVPRRLRTRVRARCRRRMPNHHYRARRWDDAQDKTLRLGPSVSRSPSRGRSLLPDRGERIRTSPHVSGSLDAVVHRKPTPLPEASRKGSDRGSYWRSSGPSLGKSLAPVQRRDSSAVASFEAASGTIGPKFLDGFLELALSIARRRNFKLQSSSPWLLVMHCTYRPRYSRLS